MPENAAVTKAVVPAAGLGTRFLPATKATPKEMLPVVDKPAIQYVVEEAVNAGLDDVLLITGRSKRSIEDHFDRNYELEEALTAKGDTEGLELIRESYELATVHYVRQGTPRAWATRCSARRSTSATNRSRCCSATTLSTPRTACCNACWRRAQQYGGSFIALMEVAYDQVSSYGVAAIEPTGEDDVVRITDLVEKPSPEDAPSNWIIIGRYVCDPAIFGVLERTPPGRGGEIQLTDALKELAQDRPGRRRRRVRRAVPRPPLRHREQDRLPAHPIQFACERPDVAPEFVPWLRKYLDNLG